MQALDGGLAGAEAGAADSVVGGVEAAVVEVVAGGGVDVDGSVCEWTEGVDGASGGVGKRGVCAWATGGVWAIGGVWEWAMGGVWPRARLTGTAMCRCDDTTTGEPCGWNGRGGMA